MRDMRFKTLSWCALSSARLDSAPLSESPCPHALEALLSTFRHSSAPGEWGRFSSTLSFVHSPPNNSILFSLYLSFSQSVALFLPSFSETLYLSVHVSPPLFPLSRMQLNQIGWISVAAWLHRYQRHQREQKSITSPLPFHQLSLSLSVFVALPSSFNLPALLFAASSSSSLSSECHSSLPSYFNMLLLIKNPVPSPSKKDALPTHFFSS